MRYGRGVTSGSLASRSAPAMNRFSTSGCECDVTWRRSTFSSPPPQRTQSVRLHPECGARGSRFRFTVGLRACRTRVSGYCVRPARRPVTACVRHAVIRAILGTDMDQALHYAPARELKGWGWLRDKGAVT